MFDCLPEGSTPVVKKKLVTFYNAPWSSLVGFKHMSFLQTQTSSDQAEAQGRRSPCSLLAPSGGLGYIFRRFFTSFGHFPLQHRAFPYFFQVITQGFKQNPRLKAAHTIPRKPRWGPLPFPGKGKGPHPISVTSALPSSNREAISGHFSNNKTL